jgi:hypothetical protein
VWQYFRAGLDVATLCKRGMPKYWAMKFESHKIIFSVVPENIYCYNPWNDYKNNFQKL